MKIFRNIILTILIIVIITGVVFCFLGNQMYSETLNGSTLEEVIAEIQKNPDYIEYENLPQNYINAVIAVEDHRYRDHGAIDLFAIGRAIYVNIINWELLEGGSTITQQVAKNIFYIENDDNVAVRKVAEIITAFDLENKYDKNEILELYVNTIYFGDGYYGIQKACQGYLGKDAVDMNLSDCTMLAGVPNAPSVYAPTVRPDLTRNRQEKVISSMVEYGYLAVNEKTELLDSLDEYYEQFEK